MTDTTEKLVKLQAIKRGTRVHLGDKTVFNGPVGEDDDGDVVETTAEIAGAIVKAKLGKIVR